MKLEDIFKKYNSMISICMVDEEEGLKEIQEFKKEFESNYRIVPKEQFMVSFQGPGNYSINVELVGPFSSNVEGERFIKEWEENRENSINKHLETNPESKFRDAPYLKLIEINDLKITQSWFKPDPDL